MTKAKAYKVKVLRNLILNFTLSPTIKTSFKVNWVINRLILIDFTEPFENWEKLNVGKQIRDFMAIALSWSLLLSLYLVLAFLQGSFVTKNQVTGIKSQLHFIVSQ